MVGRSAWLAGAACVLLAIGTTGVAHGSAPVINLDVTPRTGSDRDTYAATITIEVPGLVGPDRYWPPAFADFTVTDKKATKSTSRRYDPLAGMSLGMTLVYQYVLAPRRAGKLSTGRARIALDGVEYESPDVVIDVQAIPAGGVTGAGATSFRDPTAAGGVGAPGFRPPSFPDGAAPDVFLHAAVDRDHPYVGEQITVTWMLYTRDEVLKFDPTMPVLDGFWSETLHEPSAYFRYHDDVVDGARYQVVVVSKRALFPTRSGPLTIGRFSARVSTLYTPLGRALEIASPPIQIDVKPLPDGAPDGFVPTYVGEYRVEAEIDRAHIAAGESLTLTVTIRGRGAIRRISPPELDIEGFALRAPRDFEETIHPSTSLVSGRRTFRYWTTPTRGGAQQIPPIAIHYFSPEQGHYREARSQPLSLTVAGDPTALSVARTGRQNTITRDIRLIRDGDTISSRRVTHLYQSVWFWLASAVPALCFIGLVITDRIRAARQGDGGGRKRRGGGAARRLRTAQLHVRNRQPAELFAELSRVLHEAIEQGVGEPVRSMTRPELRGVMTRAGITDPVIARIERELDACDFARFASSTLDVQDAQRALDRVQALLDDLDGDLASAAAAPGAPAARPGEVVR